MVALTLPSVRVFSEVFDVPVEPDELTACALAPEELAQLAQRALERIAW